MAAENLDELLPPIYSKSLEDACWDSVLSSHKLFSNQQTNVTSEFYEALKLKLNVKINQEYKQHHKEQALKTQEIATHIHSQIQQTTMTKSQTQKVAPKQPSKPEKVEEEIEDSQSSIQKILNDLPQETASKLSKLPKQFLQFQEKTAHNPIASNTYIQNEQNKETNETQKSQQLVAYDSNPAQKQLQVIEPARLGTVMLSKIKKVIKPEWHRPWKLMRVISGHHGWVRSLAVDPANQFFVTGSSDRTIKFWDLATGNLKITYTGHISAVRGLVVSHKHPYLFSCGEDKTVKCWDMEQNKIIRDYHGHLSGVYCITQHPTLDLIATGGRDSVVRLWDIRTRTQVHILEGHTGTIDSLISQEYNLFINEVFRFEPQIISGSQDAFIKLWDIVSGRSIATLTNHKKSIRSMKFHPLEYTFCSSAPDNIKVWKCPEGMFLRNISGHNAIINSIAVNKENVLVSAADNGSLYFWDWKSGYNFQQIKSIPQPGSIAAENGIFCCEFDQSQLRLITGECDKTIKIYKEDEDATPESHPIDDFKLEFQNQRF